MGSHRYNGELFRTIDGYFCCLICFSFKQFSILLIIIFITELGVGIAGYVKHSELKDSMTFQFNQTIIAYEDNTEVQRAWKMIQTELNCCGINKPDDWKFVFKNQSLPGSCCGKEDAKRCTYDLLTKPEGCKNKLMILLDDNALLLGGVGLGIAGIQVNF